MFEWIGQVAVLCILWESGVREKSEFDAHGKKRILGRRCLNGSEGSR